MEYMESRMQNLYESSESERDRCYTKISELEAEVKCYCELQDKLSVILTNTANALKGKPAELSMHSWHDLAEVATEVMAQLKKKTVSFSELVKSHERLEACKADLEARKFVRFNDDECWLYQGDSDDHLESLVCPVVLSADKMREIESQLKAAKRDGILDFAKSKEFTEIFDDGFAASHAAIAAYRYANSLTGEE